MKPPKKRKPVPIDIEICTFAELQAELTAAGQPVSEHLNWPALAEAVLRLRSGFRNVERPAVSPCLDR